MNVHSPVDVVIVGAGMAGLGMAARLRQAGVNDLLVLDQAPEIGGFWRASTYASTVGDEWAVQQSYSFAPAPRSRTVWATRDGILRYQRDLVVKHDLESRLRLRQRVTSLMFDQPSATWRIRVAGKASITARRVVLAVGVGGTVAPPRLSGIDQFDGPILNTSAWDKNFDFAGKSVAVVAAGATAVHLVPELVQRAGRVRFFQRQPDWILPRWGSERGSMAGRLMPLALGTAAGRRAARYHTKINGRGLVWRGLGTRVVEGLAEAYLNRSVPDPWLRRNLSPTERVGSRRVLFSDDFYTAIQRDNCKLVPWPVTGVSAVGIRSADAMTHRADCIVFATDTPDGCLRPPFPVSGIGGTTLDERWGAAPVAFHGVHVPGFPNLFMLAGPGSVSHALSGLSNVEAQIDYVARSLALLDSLELVSLDIRPEALERERAWLAQRRVKTTWRDGVHRWYLESDTSAAELFPGTASDFSRLLAEIDVKDCKMLTEKELAEIATSIQVGVVQ